MSLYPIIQERRQGAFRTYRVTMKRYVLILHKCACTSLIALLICGISLETLPQLKIEVYSYFYGGDDLQAYKAEIVEYRIKSRLFPRNPQFRYNLGVALVTHLDIDSDRKQRLTEAAEALETCIKLDENHAAAYYWLGSIYCNKWNNPRRGITCLEKAVRLAPQNYRNQLDLAYAYKQVDDKEKARFYGRNARALEMTEPKERGSMRSVVDFED